MLNGNREKTDFDKYIRSALTSKVGELADISKESQFELRFNIDLSSVYKSSGYYELKPTSDFTLDEDTLETI